MYSRDVRRAPRVLRESAARTLRRISPSVFPLSQYSRGIIVGRYSSSCRRDRIVGRITHQSTLPREISRQDDSTRASHATQINKLSSRRRKCTRVNVSPLNASPTSFRSIQLADWEWGGEGGREAIGSKSLKLSDRGMSRKSRSRSNCYAPPLLRVSFNRFSRSSHPSPVPAALRR